MKILFITYYWPPAGGVSVQRILHFVHQLNKQGIECHVIHPAQPSYYMEDPSLNALIDDSIICHPTDIFDITKIIKRIPGFKKEGNIKSQKQGLISSISKKIRANYFIPDPKIGWVKNVIKKASTLHTKEAFDLVFTNGTPHSLHLAGLEIKQQLGIPWIADFRDPWTKIDYFEYLPLNKRARKKHETLEHKVISKADITLTVSETWQQDFVAIGAARSEYITNGFDEFIKDSPNEDFIISHVGSIHSDRSLSVVIEAIQNINRKESALKGKLKLVLVGNLDEALENTLKENIPAGQIVITGPVNHSEAKSWIGKSKLLLLPINNSKAAEGRIPAKLFEYLSSLKPIAMLGTDSGDASKIVLADGIGKCFLQNQSEDLAQYISDIEKSPEKFGYPKEKIAKYSRENLAKQLVKLMSELVAKTKI